MAQSVGDEDHDIAPHRRQYGSRFRFGGTGRNENAEAQGGDDDGSTNNAHAHMHLLWLPGACAPLHSLVKIPLSYTKGARRRHLPLACACSRRGRAFPCFYVMARRTNGRRDQSGAINTRRAAAAATQAKSVGAGLRSAKRGFSIASRIESKLCRWTYSKPTSRASL